MKHFAGNFNPLIVYYFTELINIKNSRFFCMNIINQEKISNSHLLSESLIFLDLFYIPRYAV